MSFNKNFNLIGFCRPEAIQQFGLNQSVNKGNNSKLLKPKKVGSPLKEHKKSGLHENRKSLGKLPGLKRPMAFQK